MNSQKEYWNKKIIKWEKSSYLELTQGMGLIEKIATKFRKPIKERMYAAKELLKPMIKGKTVLDLGCGSGLFIFELAKEGAEKVVGIDISSVAIEKAKKKAMEFGFEEKCEFYEGDISALQNVNIDIVTGLGFIDYLNKKQLEELFHKIANTYFLFSFPEKKFSLINIMHYFYLKSQNCPCFYKYSRKEFEEIALNYFKECYFFSVNNLIFVTNIKSIAGH